MRSAGRLLLSWLAITAISAAQRQAPPSSLAPPLMAEQLEARVAANPEDLEARGQLLVYYSANARVREWAQHLTWMVEKHPDSAVLDGPAGNWWRVVGTPWEEALVRTLRELWQKATVANPSSTAVLLHASMFYEVVDRRLAIETLRRARLVDPGDRRVVEHLAGTVFNLWMEYGSPRQELMRQLEQSRDAEEIGGLGRMLVDAGPPREGAEKWRTDVRWMLERARSLDGSNPRWAAGLEIERLGPPKVLPGHPPLPEGVAAGGCSCSNVLRLRVGANGTVKEATALEGPGPLDGAAVQSAMREKLEARGHEYEMTAYVQFGAQAAGPPVRMATEKVPRRITVGSNVQQAMLVEKVEPVYPPLAAQARIQGAVLFTVIVGQDGGVSKLTLERGHPLLVQAAQDAVKQWRYKPTLLNGQPVEVVTQVEVPFVLPQ